MKKIVLINILLAVCFYAFSQMGSGYMGKRCVAGYGFYFSPALLGSNGSGSSIIGRGNAMGGELAFNSMHQGYIEFAFKNKFMMGFSGTFYKTTFDNYMPMDATLIGIDQYGSSQNYYVSDSPQGLYTIKGLNYSVYFKFYGNKSVAPWGRYFLVGPTMRTYKCIYDPNVMKFRNMEDFYKYNPQNSGDFGPLEQQYMRFDIQFGWGKNRILFDRITIDYGINFHLFSLANAFWDTIDESIFDSFNGVETNNLNYIERSSVRRIREVNRINAYIKIGFLLF